MMTDERLDKLKKKYGQHTNPFIDCRAHLKGGDGRPCACGADDFNDLIAALKESRAEVKRLRKAIGEIKDAAALPCYDFADEDSLRVFDKIGRITKRISELAADPEVIAILEILHDRLKDREIEAGKIAEKVEALEKEVGAKNVWMCPKCRTFSRPDQCAENTLDVRVNRYYCPKCYALVSSIPKADQPDPPEKDELQKHLDYCTGIVNSWPKWKREILGGVIKPPKPTESPKPVTSEDECKRECEHTNISRYDEFDDNGTQARWLCDKCKASFVLVTDAIAVTVLEGLLEHEDFKDLEFTAPVTKIETAVATQRELCKRAIKHAIDDLKPKEAPNEDE